MRFPASQARLVTAVAALLALPPAGGRAEERLAGPIAARVVEVVDGDTLVVRARIWLGQDVETRLRIDGIDAPELRGRCARERELARQARDFLARAVGERGILLRDIRTDKYGGRVLARIERDGDAIDAVLLAAGLARPYDGRRRDAWCARGDG